MAKSRRKRESSVERRSAFRFPVSGDRSQGRLRVANAEFPVTIVDESAGGFAVEFDGATDCRLGDCLMLRAGDEWVRVRVAFLDMQDVGVERFQGCDLTSHTRLGLMRSHDEDWKLTGQKRDHVRAMRPIAVIKSKALLAAAAGFIGGLVVFGAFGLHKLERAYSLDPMKSDGSEARVAGVRDPLVLAPKVKLLKDAAEDAIESAGGALAPSAPGEGWAPTGSGRELAGTGTRREPEKPRPLQATISRSTKPNAVREVERELEGMAQKAADELPELSDKLWGEATVRLAQPNFLLRADIVQRLKLTHAQQAQLRRLFVEHRTAAGDETEDLDLLLGRRSMAVLTTQQKYLLESIRNTMPDQQPKAGE